MGALELVPPEAPPLEPVRYSRLKLMGLSPAHYHAATKDETYAMERGSAVHSLVLETEEVLGWEDGRPRRGKDYEAFAAEHEGAIILTHTEYQMAKAQADAVKANPLAMRLLDGHRENEIAFKIGDRPCGGRPDVWTPSFVTELKCTVSSHPERFAWQAYKLGYAGQLAWYSDALVLLGKAAPEAHYIVAVESKAPYVVTVFRLTRALIEQGRRNYRTWFEQLMVCEATDEWPGYCQAVVPLDVREAEGALVFGDEDEGEGDGAAA